MIDIRAHDTTAPAPGRLEPLQRFMNLHEHEPGVEETLPPSPEMVRTFLVERGLLPPAATYTDAHHATVLGFHRALHGLVASGGRRPSDEHVVAIEDVADRAGLRLRFGIEEPMLEPDPGADAVHAALGRLAAVVFATELEGDWVHLKECADENCTAVFYDRSKNHSGRWCSMQSCGNRNKVRAWRERQRQPDVADD
jgi:hypothetical protein